MAVPDVLDTVTVRGAWISPLGGGPLIGQAYLSAVGAIRSPVGNVILTTQPDLKILANGAAEWTDVVLSDSAGLAAPVGYHVHAHSDDNTFRHDRLVELTAAMVVDGVIRLEDVPDAEPGPVVATYLLASSLGHVGGPAGPLGSDGLIPTGQLPAAGGSQPADPDLSAIAALVAANGDVIQRFGGVWTNRTPAQLKASLALVIADTAGLQGALDTLTAATGAAQASADAKIAATLVDAKGDLIVATAADTVTRLAAGADGQLLRADSAQAAGLRWAVITIGDVTALQAALDGKEVAGAAAGAVTAHVGAGDPHSQYLTAAEGNAAYQPLDADLGTIAALAPGNGALIQRIAGVWAAQTTAQVKASLAIAYADIAGTVPTAALPPLAINEVFLVDDQAAMLALTAQRGDMAIRADDGRTYVLASDSPATLADWKEVLAAGQVQSVAGRSGVVVLVKADVGLGLVDNTSDAGKPISTATQAALDAKAPVASPTFIGTTTTPRLITPPVNLVDAATIATDASSGNYFRVTLAGNRTLGNPSNGIDGQRVIWELTQDGTGGRTLTLDTAFALGVDLSAVVLSTAAGKRDLLGGLFHAGTATWLVIALARGY